MKSTYVTLICSLLLLSAFTAQGQDRYSRPEYINKYKGIAIEQMEIYGIPASIKMAQALLESDNGNGRLAREANNHFGIKCKSTWTGATITHDDDAPGECFRKYPDVSESYKDHSEFLDKSARYQALFKLDPTDYKGWAVGLKSAGYATNPTYAEALIKIIEDNKLYLLDQGGQLPTQAPVMAAVQPTPDPEPAPAPPRGESSEVIDIDNYSVAVSAHAGARAVYRNNGSEFVLAKEGDSYAAIAAEFGLKEKKILVFNDLDEVVTAPERGTMVYIKAKSKRSENGKLIHITKEGETMYSISQMYGIRLSSLCGINRRPKESQVKAGQQIRLM